jgi:hypothetical protein
MYRKPKITILPGAAVSADDSIRDMNSISNHRSLLREFKKEQRPK